MRGVALEGNVGWEHLDRERYASTAVVELGQPDGGYGWLFPKGDHANLGVGGWDKEGPHLRDHLARLSRSYGIDPDVLTEVRGHRLPMRRVGATTPARDNVVLVGDAAGLVDPLSGDGMYEAFTSARLAADAILAGDLDAVPGGAGAEARPSRGRVVVGQARSRPPPRGVLLGRSLTGRLRRRQRTSARRCRASERGPRPRPAAVAPRCTRRAPRLTTTAGAPARDCPNPG